MNRLHLPIKINIPIRRRCSRKEQSIRGNPCHSQRSPRSNGRIALDIVGLVEDQEVRCVAVSKEPDESAESLVCNNHNTETLPLLGPDPHIVCERDQSIEGFHVVSCENFDVRVMLQELVLPHAHSSQRTDDQDLPNPPPVVLCEGVVHSDLGLPCADISPKKSRLHLPKPFE